MSSYYPLKLGALPFIAYVTLTEVSKDGNKFSDSKLPLPFGPCSHTNNVG